MRRYNIILTMVIEYLYKNTYTVFKTRWLWIRYQNVDGYFYSSVGTNNFSYIIYILNKREFRNWIRSYNTEICTDYRSIFNVPRKSKQNVG